MPHDMMPGAWLHYWRPETNKTGFVFATPNNGQRALRFAWHPLPRGREPDRVATVSKCLADHPNALWGKREAAKEGFDPTTAHSDPPVTELGHHLQLALSLGFESLGFERLGSWLAEL